MRCSVCDHENPEYAVVCEHCGCFLAKDKVPSGKKRSSILDPLGEKRIRCSACWHSNPAGSKTCERCGMPLSYVPYPEREGADEEFVEREEEERRKKEAAEKQSNVDREIATELKKPDTNPVPEGMVRCRNCWRDNPVILTYCQYCDQKLDRPRKKPGSEENEDIDPDKTVICTVCGRKNEAGERSCFYCGSDLPGYPPREGASIADRIFSSAFSPYDDYDEPEEGTGLFYGTVDAFFKARALDQSEALRKQEEEREKIERSKQRGSINYAVPGKKRCRSCWYDNPKSAEKCEKCGATLPKSSRKK